MNTPETATTGSIRFAEAGILSGVIGRRNSSDRGLSVEDIRTREKSLLADLAGIRTDSVFILSQVHGVQSFTIGPDDVAGETFFGEGDALYTDTPGKLLCVRTADCLPVFFVFRKSSSNGEKIRVGVIHAGWKGLAEGIIPQTLQKASDFFQDGKKISARIYGGPCIGGKSYEVGYEVASRFPRYESRGSSFYLDIWENAKLQIEELALPGLMIEEKDVLCTFLENDRFYSHRRKDSGRNLNYIMITGENGI